jgi:hypothetical protein
LMVMAGLMEAMVNLAARRRYCAEHGAPRPADDGGHDGIVPQKIAARSPRPGTDRAAGHGTPLGMVHRAGGQKASRQKHRYSQFRHPRTHVLKALPELSG